MRRAWRASRVAIGHVLYRVFIFREIESEKLLVVRSTKTRSCSKCSRELCAFVFNHKTSPAFKVISAPASSNTWYQS
jgi:hypothetical protein